MWRGHTLRRPDKLSHLGNWNWDIVLFSERQQWQQRNPHPQSSQTSQNSGHCSAVLTPCDGTEGVWTDLCPCRSRDLSPGWAPCDRVHFPCAAGWSDSRDVKPQAFSFPHSLFPSSLVFLCSLILRPQGPHPHQPAKPPLIIDLRKIHIQCAHRHKQISSFFSPCCLHRTSYNFLLRPKVAFYDMTGTLASDFNSLLYILCNYSFSLF